MPQEAPQALIESLKRLGLATEDDVRAVGRRAKKLARGLPLFESVWVDALAQARVLTPFQAAEINAGRGDGLHVGPYVIAEALPSPPVMQCYRAKERVSGEQVRLAVATIAVERAEEITAALNGLVAASGKLTTACLAPIVRAGIDGRRAWTACRLVEGRTAGDWMIHNGRFPPEVVLEIARQMLPGLVSLEEGGRCHGDLCPAGVLLADEGSVVLPHPGLRPILRPEEGYAHADLAPEAFDGVAPERIRQGTAADVRSDVYACGVLWWHMLAGRSPIPGGDSLAKLRAVQTTKVPDVRQIAPESPGPLAAAVSACMEHQPARRPESMARLAAMLGESTRNGRKALGGCLRDGGMRPAPWVAKVRKFRMPGQMPAWLAAGAACLVVVGVIAWWIAQGGIRTVTTAPPSRESVRARLPEREAPVAAIRPPVAATATASREVVLPGGGPIDASSLRLSDGQRVHGRTGARPMLMVPRTGLVVAAEDVRFEDIDFLWQPRKNTEDTGDAAIVHVQASRATFAGCRFFTSAATAAPPAAVRWTHPVDRAGAAMRLPSGQIRLTNCILREVGAGVDCRTLGTISIEMANVLCLASGPLVRLDHAPGADEPVAIRLTRSTLRQSGPLLECQYQEVPERPGKITVEATGCALVLGPKAALLALRGPASPAGLLAGVVWTGQGSMVSPRASIAGWYRKGEAVEVLDEAAVSISGLVRSDVEFAGPLGPEPGASQITGWQAPLESTDPPGVDAAALPSSGKRDVRTGNGGK